MRSIFTAIIQLLVASAACGQTFQDRKYLGRSPGSRFVPSASDEQMADRMTIANMTCSFFMQPLNHFVPHGKSPNYQQRYCSYSGYVPSGDANKTAPILFYTGNESPLEQYINHTGLMWELAPKLQAHVVFAEHRYEGQSLPPANLTSNCMSYASTIQALADYAKLIQYINPGAKAPLVAFGGSYGGMLSGWFRMKYPNLVAGAIAASAPIGGFPQQAFDKIDSCARVISSAMELDYPSSTKQAAPASKNHCTTNMLSAWPLIQYLMDQKQAVLLQRIFRLCEPPQDANDILEWAQAIWFDLAEGEFPYPSSYVPFALLHEKVELPAWPLQAACWNVSQLHQDRGVQIEGNLSNVDYTITYGDSLALHVDWDQVTVATDRSVTTGGGIENDPDPNVIGLLTSVRDAVSIWYNITKDVKCYDVSSPAPNMKAPAPFKTTQTPFSSSSSSATKPRRLQQVLSHQDRHKIEEPTEDDDCSSRMKTSGSWEPLCCNDELNLVITEARGLGNDIFWPPSHPRGTRTYADLVKTMEPESCPDPKGIFGYSTEPIDLWSTWLDAYYGSGDMKGHSNIVFSNGLLDPWSAGGVYPKNGEGQSVLPNIKTFTDRSGGDTSSMIQNITSDGSVIALIIALGGHHTDLMYADDRDPISVSKARQIEYEHIKKWIRQWN